MEASVKKLRESVLEDQEKGKQKNSFILLDVKCPICGNRISSAYNTEYYKDINIVIYNMNCDNCKTDFNLEISLGE